MGKLIIAMNNKVIQLYCDKKSTINIAHNLVQYDQTKHVEVD